MKKIIVTGGLGFIGSNLIELLLKKNFYVINIDKGTYSSNFYNTKNFSKNYQSGPLSFEYFLDGTKIITNSGFGKNIVIFHTIKKIV